MQSHKTTHTMRRDMKKFTKNDQGFVCENCGREVMPLGYTSRNHCPFCLYSLHVDIMPGDRQNTCHGLMRPVYVEDTSKKGRVIHYKCTRCGVQTTNVSANDDDFDTILQINRENAFRK